MFRSHVGDGSCDSIAKKYLQISHQDKDPARFSIIVEVEVESFRKWNQREKLTTSLNSRKM